MHETPVNNLKAIIENAKDPDILVKVKKLLALKKELIFVKNQVIMNKAHKLMSPESGDIKAACDMKFIIKGNELHQFNKYGKERIIRTKSYITEKDINDMSDMCNKKMQSLLNIVNEDTLKKGAM